MSPTCSVESCERALYCRGYCEMHYGRVRRLGHPGEAEARYIQNKGAVCSADGCTQAAKAAGLCQRHYDRLRRAPHLGFGPRRDPIGAASRNWKGGRQRHQGYVLLYVGPEDPLYEAANPNPPAPGRYMLEHRYVMARHLGRPLLNHEDVHHMNGQRDDNRIENLELWSRSHPRGQRVEDKLAWAREFIALYEG